MNKGKSTMKNSKIMVSWWLNYRNNEFFFKKFNLKNVFFLKMDKTMIIKPSFMKKTQKNENSKISSFFYNVNELKKWVFFGFLWCLMKFFLYLCYKPSNNEIVFFFHFSSFQKTTLPSVIIYSNRIRAVLFK